MFCIYYTWLQQPSLYFIPLNTQIIQEMIKNVLCFMSAWLCCYCKNLQHLEELHGCAGLYVTQMSICDLSSYTISFYLKIVTIIVQTEVAEETRMRVFMNETDRRKSKLYSNPYTHSSVWSLDYVALFNNLNISTY